MRIDYLKSQNIRAYPLVKHQKNDFKTYLINFKCSTITIIVPFVTVNSSQTLIRPELNTKSI